MSPVWTMPEWMKQYVEYIGETGGNDVEELVNGKTKMSINLPLAVLEIAVRAQVDLLARLHVAGSFRPETVYLVRRSWPSHDPDFDDPSRVIGVVLSAEEAKDAIRHEVADVKGWVVADDGLSAELHRGKEVLDVEPWNPCT